jgi:hypothetical protein
MTRFNCSGAFPRPGNLWSNARLDHAY